jgi:hypothetical protein
VRQPGCPGRAGLQPHETEDQSEQVELHEPVGPASYPLFPETRRVVLAAAIGFFKAESHALD